ncbi:MAG: hypothetical protein OHK005_02210 [Candidatus Methylacidiphilales bacterium]
MTRIFLPLGAILFSLITIGLTGCESTRTSRPTPYSGLDLRTTERLQERRRSLESVEQSYLSRGGPPTKMAHRREMARLSDEFALEKIEEKQAIERELARRYAAGDRRAYFSGIEAFLSSDSSSSGANR